LQIALRGSAYALDSSYLVALPYDGSWTGFWSTLHLPSWEGIASPIVWKTAVTLAIVASLETLLSLDAADRMDPLKRVSNKNRELFAQGAGNLTAGLVGGLPVTAVIVRTSANVSAGGTQRSSAIFHGFWLLLCAMFIPTVLNLIPLATLATVLVLVGYKLCKPAVFQEMAKLGQLSLMIFVSTIIAILLTDLLIGIFIGMALSLSFTFNKFRRNVLTVQRKPGETIILFAYHVTFLHKAALQKILSVIPADEVVIVQTNPRFDVHHDIHDLLNDYTSKAAHRNIQVRLVKA